MTKNENGFVFHINAMAKLPATSMKANITKGTTLEITFDASKLVSLVSTIATASGNSTASSAVSLLKKYKGVYAGFEFNK